ncbi:MAG: 5' nucleotidase, NT5C type, partial [Candidatus Saccharimonadales bacterium]
MSKEILAVDADEVLFPFLDEFLNFNAGLTGKTLNKSEFKSYEFSGPLGITIPETLDRIFFFHKNIDNTQVQPIDGSKIGVEKLASAFDLIVVTARDSEFERETLSWLKEHFSDYFK